MTMCAALGICAMGLSVSRVVYDDDSITVYNWLGSCVLRCPWSVIRWCELEKDTVLIKGRGWRAIGLWVGAPSEGRLVALLTAKAASMAPPWWRKSMARLVRQDFGRGRTPDDNTMKN
jgi:hypothetical protein